MPVTRIAAVQFAPELDPAANAKRMRVLATEAAGLGATLVLFPEYSSSFNPKLDAQVLGNAQIVKGEFVAAMQELARDLGITLVFGLVEATADERKFANTVLAVDPTGAVLTKYQKAHLYDAFGQKESDKVLAGKLGDPPVFEHGGLVFGVQTCYDLRFPEQTRWLVDGGAQVILVPAEWVAGEHKIHHWQTLLTARAIENTVYVVSADHPGPIGVGHSSIIDPLGITRAALPADGEAIVVADIDSEVIDGVRAVNPSIHVRRFSVHPNPEGKTADAT